MTQFTKVPEMALIPMMALINQALGTNANTIEDEIDTYFRFPAPGKPESNRDCWAIFTGPFIAYCGNWITGEKYQINCPYDMSDLEAIEYVEELLDKPPKANSQKAEYDRVARDVKTMIKRWGLEPYDNAYCNRKNIPAINAYGNNIRLLVPLININGDVRSCQSIYPKGFKSFEKGGEIKGNFALIGNLHEAQKVYVCEGYATGVSIYQYYGPDVAVVCAMNAGNLLPVCSALADSLNSSVAVYVVSDNDHRTKGNPGLTKATEAAESIGATLITLPFPCANSECSCTDFNDFANCKEANRG